MHHSDKDPIIAVATAAGRGGIGILRLSFGKALEAQIVGRLFGENCTLKARYAHLLPFLGTDGGVLDRAIVLLFPAPHSYTGESVLEIQAHGGPVLLSLIMRTCLEKCRDLGLRMAEPGEFTRRAFMNGRMDLTQAEAVADLIDAVSESAVQAAGRSLSGEFSNAVRDVDGNITELRAFIEATLDFPEEDIDVIGSEKVRTRLVQAETGIRAILENARQGQVLREGVTVAIVRDDLIADGSAFAQTPQYMDLKAQAAKGSMLNTPNTFGIYVCGKVFRWVEKTGGLAAMAERNWAKANLLYDLLEHSELFHSTTQADSRSIANVTFRTGDAELDAAFVAGAAGHQIQNVKGHRLVGGMRASVYNAVTMEDVQALASYMKDFETQRSLSPRSN